MHFLALNTSCVTLIPTTIIGIRLLYGSTDPTEIVGPTIMATAFSMTVAIVVDRILRQIYSGKVGKGMFEVIAELSRWAIP